jgi:gliding motility-associated-like protein
MGLLKHIFIVFLFLLTKAAYGQQFRTQGTAVQSGPGIYQITADAISQVGMVTNYYSVDLTTNFTLNFQLNFGTKDDNGADGLAFMLSRSCNPTLTQGGGLGVQGLPNTLIIDFDTYANGLPDDLNADHTGIYANGLMTNAGLIMDAQTSPVCLNDLCANVEDGQWHTVQIQWEYISAISQRISVYFDGQLRGSSTRNHIANEFANATSVYWSVAGSTGALSNIQQMRVTDYTNIFTYCEGTVFTLTAPANGTNYSWTGNSSVTNVASYTAITSGSYTCTYTNNCGQPESVSFDVIVPLLLVPVLQSNQNACTGTDAVFTITSQAGNHIRYQLNGGPVQELIVGATGVATLTVPAITTDQTLQLIEVSIGTCIRPISLTNTVFVRPLPVVTANGTAVCAGGTVQLNGNPAGGTWTGSSISASGLFNAAAVAPGSYTVSYQYIDQFGCGNTATAQVVVHALPQVLAQNSSVCKGSAIQLQGTPAGGVWTGSVVTAAGLFDATNLATGTYQVNYSYTDVNSCSNQAAATVQVNALPVLQLTDAEVCTGTGVQLTAIPIGGNWSGGFVSSNGSFNASGLAAGLYPVSYSFTDINGCSASATANVRVYSDQILPQITASPATCEGSDVVFRLNGIPGSVITYSLNAGQPTQIVLDAAGNATININNISADQVLQISQVESGPCIRSSTLQATVPVKRKKVVRISREICKGDLFEGYGTAGTYTDLFTGINGCDSTRILDLSIRSYIKPDLGPDKVLCEGDTLRLDPGSFSSYVWSTGETTASILVTRLGEYMVATGTVCGMDTDRVMVGPGLCDIYFPTGFTPNGDGKNDLFRAETNLHPAFFELQVFNRWGQRIFSSKDPALGWDGTIGGKKADNGVFVYHASFVIHGIRRTARGLVTLIR